MSAREVGVGIIGFGTVGQGAYQVLDQNAEIIARQIGAPARVRAVADIRVDAAREGVGPGINVYDDANALIGDEAVQIVCELIGGVGAAGDFVRRALEGGKHVVTANKELVAKRGPELLALAERKKVDFYFEASVGGGIPIISPLRIGLAGNDIRRVIGIVNGTTNYILTKMSAEGTEMREVLAEAQHLGYAEPDPTNDIEGFDARYKLTILASLAFHARVEVDQVLCEGISSLSARDIEYARALGYGVKLLAIAKNAEGAIEARVHPALVPLAHPIASVSGVNNAIYVSGDAVGDVMFYGPGAGAAAAGSAVVGDVIEIGRNILSGSTGRLRTVDFQDIPIRGAADIIARYYVRLRAADRPGVLAAISREYGDHEVSIAAVVQKDTRNGVAELIFLTHEVREKGFFDALEAIAGLDVVNEVCSFIRVEE